MSKKGKTLSLGEFLADSSSGYSAENLPTGPRQRSLDEDDYRHGGRDDRGPRREREPTRSDGGDSWRSGGGSSFRGGDRRGDDRRGDERRNESDGVDNWRGGNRGFNSRPNDRYEERRERVVEERPAHLRLNLQRRQTSNVDGNDREERSSSSATPFGSARPVNTDSKTWKNDEVEESNSPAKDKWSSVFGSRNSDRNSGSDRHYSGRIGERESSGKSGDRYGSRDSGRFNDRYNDNSRDNGRYDNSRDGGRFNDRYNDNSRDSGRYNDRYNSNSRDSGRFNDRNNDRDSDYNSRGNSDYDRTNADEVENVQSKLENVSVSASENKNVDSKIAAENDAAAQKKQLKELEKKKKEEAKLEAKRQQEELEAAKKLEQEKLAQAAKDNEKTIEKVLKSGKKGTELVAFAKTVWPNKSDKPLPAIVLAQLLRSLEDANQSGTWTTLNEYGSFLNYCFEGQKSVKNQLQFLFALQLYLHEFKWTKKGLLETLFKALHAFDIIDDESYLEYKYDTEDTTPGKMQAIIETSEWLTWLENNEEDDDDEDEDDYE